MTIELIDFNYAPAVELFANLGNLEIQRVDRPTGTADSTIVCIVGDQSVHYLEQTKLPDTGFLIFAVFTLTGAVVPFLKQADHVIWFGPMQERITEQLLGLQFPGESIPFPVDPIVSTKQGDVFVAVGDPFDPAQANWYREVIAAASNWFSCPKSAEITVLFPVDQSVAPTFAQFKMDIMANSPNPRLQIRTTLECSSEEIRMLISRASSGEYFSQELSVDQIETFIAEKNITLMFVPIGSNPLIELLRSANLTTTAGSGGVIRSQLNADLPILSRSAFANQLTELIADAPKILQEKQNRVQNTPVDTLETLDIVQGKPLSNRWIFSICFRNQEQKIVRALESIVAQEGNHDIGIAIVDDGSADRSSELILDYLKDKSLDFVLVKNKVRRFASRNFYNIINFLTEGTESVIIELDGDDFLNGSDVLNRLSQEYSKGVLKTSGSFITFPDAENQVAKNLLDRRGDCDFSRPWSLTACNSWLPLRSCHRSIAAKVELPYFLDRETGNWLAERHDSITNSRMIELAGPNRCAYIEEPLYVYDLSGADHDHGDSDEFDRSHAFIKLITDIQKYYRAYSI